MESYLIGPVTERLRHRALTVDDAEAFFTLNSHPDVMRYTHEPLLKSLDEARSAIAGYPDFQTVGFGRWACVLKESGDVIGFCGLKYLTDLEVVDVGYRFLPEYWGLWLATEACRACLEFGFEVLQLERIVGFVLPENTASIRVLEKVGMTLVGTVEMEGVLALHYGAGPAFGHPLKSAFFR